MNSESGHHRIENKQVFEQVFKTNYSALCGYANGFLHDADAAEEVVQEVMVKVWMNRENLSFTSSVESYLFRSVRNGCMNVLKHIGIREQYKLHRSEETEQMQASQEEELLGSELSRKIRQAIDALPMERRRVFIMSRYDGLTYQQIADQLGISVKTVENQMGKALQFLRKELSEYLPLILLCFSFFDN